MLYNAQGIVIKKSKQENFSTTADIYTDKYGKQKYIIKGLGDKKNKISISHFNNLKLVEIIANTHNSNFCHYIKEIKSNKNNNIENCFIKLNISFFISEFLDKSLHYRVKDLNLFQYIKDAITNLNYYIKGTDLSNFPLLFIIGITKYLGFYPVKDSHLVKKNCDIYFDIKEAKFTNLKPNNPFMDVESSKLFMQLLENNEFINNSISSSRETKRKLIKNLLMYYEIHSGLSSPIKSYDIITDLFN